MTSSKFKNRKSDCYHSRSFICIYHYRGFYDCDFISSRDSQTALRLLIPVRESLISRWFWFFPWKHYNAYNLCLDTEFIIFDNFWNVSFGMVSCRTNKNVYFSWTSRYHGQLQSWQNQFRWVAMIFQSCFWLVSQQRDLIGRKYKSVWTFKIVTENLRLQRRIYFAFLSVKFLCKDMNFIPIWQIVLNIFDN